MSFRSRLTKSIGTAPIAGSIPYTQATLAQEMLNAIRHMAHFDPPGGNPRQKKKSADQESKHSVDEPAKQDGLQETETSPSDPVGGVERTRRLFQAALRLWELKRRIRH
jgi:hypothetical protein